MIMVTGKTKSGYEFSIEKEKFNDMELMDMLGEMHDNPFMLGNVIEKILGKEEKKKLYDSLRNEAGRVPVEAAQDALDCIFNADTAGKK